MIVRLVTESDLSEYLRLRQASEDEYPQYVGATVEAELSAGVSGLPRLFADYGNQGHSVFGLFNDKTILGALSMTRKNSRKYRHKAFLWGMYIFPEFRKTGASSFIMDYCLSWAKDQDDLLSIILYVTTTNGAGIRFYERYGFKKFGTECRHMYAANAYHDAHMYELVL